MLEVRVTGRGRLRFCLTPLFPEAATRWLESWMRRTSVGHPRQGMELTSIILSVGGSRCLEHSPLALEVEYLSVCYSLRTNDWFLGIF